VRLARRTVLAAGGVGASVLVAGCGGPDSGRVAAVHTPAERITYGDDPSQWVDVRQPDGTDRGLVAVIHGGFWKAQYGAEYGEPLALDLLERGWATANIEYRRVGNGGGYPETLDDIHHALGALGSLTAGPVVALGHSAGGHLATWAAARGRFERWAGGVALTHVVSQAGVLDLRSTIRQHLGDDAALAFLGDPDDTTYERADPLTQVPLDVPVWAVHARDDDTVPFEQAETYVAAATRAGATARLVEVTGGHFEVVDPASDAWAACVEVLDGIAG
jgi:acetyl esterase/lipase